MAARKNKPKAEAITIHMPGQYSSWAKATGRQNIATDAIPTALGFTFTDLPSNGWQVIDPIAGGDPTTGTNGTFFLAAQGGKLDNNLRFQDEDLFLPTNVAISKTGPIQAWGSLDSSGTPAFTRYPQDWTDVPFLQEVIYITTDSRILDNWQSFTAGLPVNNPMYSQFYFAGRIGEQPVTGNLAGAVLPLLGADSVPLSKILYAHSISYQGGNSNAAFQAIGKDVWGGGTGLAAQSLYWARAYMWIADSDEGTGNTTTFVKFPDLNLTMSGIREDSDTLSFIMGLRRNLGPTQ